MSDNLLTPDPINVVTPNSTKSIMDFIQNNAVMIGCVLIIFLIIREVNKHPGNFTNEDENDQPKLQNRNFDPKLVRLLVGTFVILFVLGSISFYLYNQENGKTISTIEDGATIFRKIGLWLNNNPIPSGILLPGTTIPKLTMIHIIAGMAFGIIFGFIDNAGLFFGMDALDPYVKRWFGTDVKIAAGVGNTFSDVIGAFAGSFAGSIVQNQLKSKLPDCYESPLWAEAIGIFIGCILGIVGPKVMIG